jgi:hypothetical protein
MEWASYQNAGPHKGYGKGFSKGQGKSKGKSGLLGQVAELLVQLIQPTQIQWNGNGSMGKGKAQGKGNQQQPAGPPRPKPASLVDFWPSPKVGLKDDKGKPMLMEHPKHASQSVPVLWICSPTEGCGQPHCSWSKKYCASCNLKRPPPQVTAGGPSPQGPKPLPGKPAIRRVTFKPEGEGDSALEDGGLVPEDLEDEDSVAIAPMLKVARHCKLLASLGVPQAVAAAKTLGFNIHLPQKEESTRIQELADAVTLLEHVTKAGNLECIQAVTKQIEGLQPKAPSNISEAKVHSSAAALESALGSQSTQQVWPT